MKPEFGAKGTIFSFTVVESGVGERFLPQAPYAIAIIQLLSGELLTCQLTDLDPVLKENDPTLKDQINIGDPVEIVTRKIFEEGKAGVIHYGPKARKI